MQTPDRAAISAWLREYLSDLADGVRISDESRLYEDLGLDSLDSVELAMAIEEEFRVEMPDDEWDDLEKRFLFKNVVDFVATKLQASGRA
jgi:acyl carrier protein